MKKRVVPNKYHDKWLFYLLQNLNKATDLGWVCELLEKIEENQEEIVEETIKEEPEDAQNEQIEEEENQDTDKKL